MSLEFFLVWGCTGFVLTETHISILAMADRLCPYDKKVLYWLSAFFWLMVLAAAIAKAIGSAA